MKPQVQIPALLFEKIMWLVNNDDKAECSWLCKATRTADTITLIDAVMPEQKNSATETTMAANSIGRVMYLTKDMPGELSVHVHSHVDMKAFWSGTDMEMIKQNAKHSPWFVHIVVNKKKETLACLYVKEPFELLVDNLEVTILPHATLDMIAQWNKEYADAVTLDRGWQGAEGFNYDWHTSEYDHSWKSPVPFKTQHVNASDTPKDRIRAGIAECEARISQIEEEVDRSPHTNDRHDLMQEYWTLNERLDALEDSLATLEAPLVAGGKQ